MPVALRKYGLDLHRKVRGQDLEFARDVRRTLLELQDSLKGTSARIVQDIWYSPLPNEQRWVAKRRTYMGYFRTQIDGTYERLARRVETLQKRGFLLGFTEFRKLVNELYPRRYRKVVKEGVAFDISLTPSEEEIQEAMNVLEQDVEFQFMFRGEVNDSFKQFLADQLDTGKPPGSLIRTLPPEHVQLVQREALSTIEQGLAHAHTRDRVIANLASNVTDPKIRKRMENNVMRIARTSHQQAVNAEMSSWGMANRAVVKELERVADGRPCVACVPPGTMVRTGDGVRSIGALVPDMGVMTVKGRSQKIAKVMSRAYSGDLIVIGTGGAWPHLRVTPEHPLYCAGDIWVEARDLKLGNGVYVVGDDGKRGISRIMSLALEYYSGMVYNLEVEEDESYVANGFIVHNCVALDGRRYKVGSRMDDHPQGMCIFIPVMKTPSEMGLNVPPDLEKRLWKAQQREYPTMGEKFNRLFKDEKRKVFGNDALFNLWWPRRSWVKLTDLVVRRKGMISPMSFRQAVQSLQRAPLAARKGAKLAADDVLMDKYVKALEGKDIEKAGEFAFKAVGDTFSIKTRITEKGVRKGKAPMRLASDADTKELFGPFYRDITGYYRSNKDTLHLTKWGRSQVGLDRAKLMIHETLHSYGSGSRAVTWSEGSTEMMTHMFFRAHGTYLQVKKSHSYYHYMDFVSRMVYIAGQGNRAKMLSLMDKICLRQRALKFAERDYFQPEFLNEVSKILWRANPKAFKARFGSSGELADAMYTLEELCTTYGMKAGSVDWKAKMMDFYGMSQDAGYTSLNDFLAVFE